MCMICADLRPYSDTCDYEQLDGLTGADGAIRTETADAPASTFTGYSMSVGDSFRGTIGSSGDQDWVRITLTAGQTYDIDLNGAPSGSGTLSDPYLRLYNSSGSLVTENDDSGGTFESHLTYTPTTGGTYYVSAGAYSLTQTGTYTMTVTESVPAPVATLDQLADYLTDGYWNDTGQAPHHFNTSGSNVIDVHLGNLTASGRQLARWALEAWEAVADIEFREVSSSFRADITFDDTDANSAYATASWDGFGNTTSAHVNIGTGWLSTYGTNIGSYSFQTYIHEIGHALGLGHQGGYNGLATYGSDETFANDSWQVSVMSYFSQTDNTTVNATLADVVSTMSADIVAIQSLYGAAGSGTLTAGNTTYGLGHTLGSSWLGQLFTQMFSASPNSAIYDGGPVAATLYDAGGRDIIDFSNDTNAQTVNLAGEGISDVYGQTGNLIIARGTVIEEYRAGSGNDTVTGNDTSNVLIGNAGNDTLSGLRGFDTINGGAGNDTIEGGAGNDTINGGGGIDIINGGIGWDTLNGDDGNDTIRALDGYDTVNGGAGDDILFGNNGNDIMNGGGGNDTMNGGLGFDTMNGDDGNDIISGLSGFDTINGGTGNDTLNGNAGNDTMEGGSGRDTLNGGIGRDFLSGGNDDDILNGNNGFDTLIGGTGNDTLNGHFGNDTLNGSAGNDTMTGGLGFDLFIFNGGTDEITDFTDDQDTVRLDDALWTGTLSVQDVIDTYASVVGTNTVFDFGGGNVLTLTGVTDLNSLTDDIAIF